MSSKVECLFGFHNYSNEITKDKDGNNIYLCTICKRNGLYKDSNGYEEWHDYDDKGNEVHYKSSDGFER